MTRRYAIPHLPYFTLPDLFRHGVARGKRCISEAIFWSFLTSRSDAC